MIHFNNSYARLPDAFFERRTEGNSFRPSLLALNHGLMRELGLDLSGYSETELGEILCANRFAPGSEPLAMAYAGHQFGHFVPQLGDGRALLLGEFLGPDSARYDIHLKGSGRTAFSRRGDGRSALGPVVREYLLSEGFHALGIPTTRSLCAVRTGEMVYRDEPKPGGVLTRVARSHIRIGTFQYFAARADWSNLKILADYSIARLYPELDTQSHPTERHRYLEFWRAVAGRQIRLVAQWMSVGFIHGVMNTDNINVSGETIDFGPCAFLDEFNRGKVFSSIDEQGRYRYENQPKILFWNLARLAESLIPVMEGALDELARRFEDELQALPKEFEREHQGLMMKKLGLLSSKAGDQEMLEDWLNLLEKHSIDFTLAHVDLQRLHEGRVPCTDISQKPGFQPFFESWKHRIAEEGDPETSMALMNKSNPRTIPRNHQVERVIEHCERGEDGLFLDFLKAIQNPFAMNETPNEYQNAPTADQRVSKTFCGT